MMFLRHSARFVFIRSSKIEELKDFFLACLQGESLSFEEALQKGGEYSSILFLTPPGLSKTFVDDAQEIIFIPHEDSYVLARLFDSKINSLAVSVDFGPKCILMRYLENGEKVMDQICKQYNAEKTNWHAGISEGEVNDTLIAFTECHLSRSLKLEKLLDSILLIAQPASKLYREICKDGFMYLTHALEEKKWYEVKINIYERSRKFKENYERLGHVLSDLDVGLIIAESWTTDHAFALLNPVVYQIKLLTFIKPVKIKKILLGLEYDKNCKRIVDFDLYVKSKRISWLEKEIKKEIKDKFRLREDVGCYYRSQLLGKVSNNVRRYL